MLSEKERLYAESLLQYCDDPIPGYFEFLNKTYISFMEFGIDFEKYPSDPYFPLHMLRAIDPLDLILVFILAIIFVILRISFTDYFLKPFSNWLQLKSDDITKFNESSWKFLIYLCFWCFEWYILIGSGKYEIYHYPLRTWKNIHFTMEMLSWKIPTDIYILYVSQMGFYIYSIYAVSRFDAWRTDSMMLIVHHFLTLFLLGFSFIMRYHQVGALVLYLHDIADVFLEFAKCNVYLKDRSTGMVHLNRWISNITFVLFLFVWYVFRLYWYPLKVLHTTNWGVYITQLGADPKMYLVLNSMLVTLLIMNIYWFCIIVRLGYKIATGQLTEIEDLRETELEEYKIKQYQISNGDSKSTSTINNIDIKYRNKTVSSNGDYVQMKKSK